MIFSSEKLSDQRKQVYLFQHSQFDSKESKSEFNEHETLSSKGFQQNF
ncbi:hypothetical protein PAUR_a3191 [Pseudoalteromonas aurantia 208]|uniref:Orphan protein n=1 Tax=Pseudoalteromonas aurantia 208 TaxID=1314867 RepID=A0ABR9E5F7_9GAMM|nr:hypothetical protein [Pseudoalteromonas aurantia 208]